MTGTTPDHSGRTSSGTPVRSSSPNLHEGMGKPLLVGLILAGAGFVVSVTTSSTRTRNGVLTECSYTDFGALALGTAAVGAGLVAIVAALTRPMAAGGRARNVGLGLVCIAIGGLHVLRGLGTVGFASGNNPCL